MHSLNLGIYTVVLAEGLLALARSSEKELSAALKECYLMFKTWLRDNKLQCSQRLWSKRSLHLESDPPNYPWLKVKAFNGRIVLAWLSESWLNTRSYACFFSGSAELPSDEGASAGGCLEQRPAVELADDRCCAAFTKL